jgi:hypothetical protein
MSSEKLQIVAALAFAASAIAASGALAAGPDGSWRDAVTRGAIPAYASQSWVSLELGAMAPDSWRPADPFALSPGLALAGATLRAKGGWSASLFVSRVFAAPDARDASLLAPASSAVNAQLARSLSPSLRVTFDAFNLLDHREPAMDEFMASRTYAPAAMATGYLVHPGEPRGFRIGLRKTF